MFIGNKGKINFYVLQPARVIDNAI